MAMWLYQLSQEEWTPSRYRLDIWEGERWRWRVGKISGSERPSVGDRVLFFFAKAGCDEPGFYGWAVILRWEEYGENDVRMYFCPVAPSDQLKMCPWWDGPDGSVQQLATEIRVPIPQGTLWRVPDHLIATIGVGIARWTSGQGAMG